MIAVSNACRRSFGTLSRTSPALVCRTSLLVWKLITVSWPNPGSNANVSGPLPPIMVSPGAVHVVLELAVLLGLGLGCVDDGFGLLQRAARHAGGLGGLVGGAALRSLGQVARSFAACSPALAL